MLTKISIKNFKKLDVEFKLDSIVTFVGPNSSGKTSVLQALSLWSLGVSKQLEVREKKGIKNSSKKFKDGISIERREILSIPANSVYELFKNNSIRKGRDQVHIDVVIFGKTDDQKNPKTWELGLTFYSDRPSNLYCKPLADHCKINENIVDENEVLNIARTQKIGLLPPMSGLAAIEKKWDKGHIDDQIGQGLTAQVLRNLCYRLYQERPDQWERYCSDIQEMFKVDLQPPQYFPINSQLTLSYIDNKKEFDLLQSGRGFQQVMLILAFIYCDDYSALLIDEPDAHLEVLRQREIYATLREIAREKKFQIILASHSEQLIETAFEQDIVIGLFEGKEIFSGSKESNGIEKKKEYFLKTLNEIKFSDYLEVSRKKWILFLEGDTDLSLLKKFAKKLNHSVYPYLQRPYVVKVRNDRGAAVKIFESFKAVVKDVDAIAIFDRLDGQWQSDTSLSIQMWKKNEIENYIPLVAIERYIESQAKKEGLDIFATAYVQDVKNIAKDLIPPIALANPDYSWWSTEKMSRFYENIFTEYCKTGRTGLTKSYFYVLIDFLLAEEIDSEIKQKLDAICAVAQSKEILKKEE